MADLYVAVVLMSALSLGAFGVALRSTRAASSRTCDVLALATIGGVLLYLWIGWQHSRLAALLPFSSLVVLGNWFLPAVGFLAGLVWRRVPGSVVRRAVSLTALVAAGGYATVLPLLGNAPKCGNLWDQGVCVQTTNQTCTAASAATLLTLHGITANEQEMAGLCLTREGTTWQGLYRGLKLKTAGTRWDVQVVECGDDELPKLAGPMILSVGLARGARGDTDGGWEPGVQHSVVLLKFNRSGLAEIADPTPNCTFEQWTPETLGTLWRGTAVRLVERGK